MNCFFFQSNSGGSGGAGGGAGIQWNEDASAPVSSVENGILVYSFPDGEQTQLYAAIKVPASYTAGNQIFLRGYFYSDGTSGTVLLSTTTYLVRPAQDQISSQTNAHTSTNGAVTLSAGTVDEPQSVSWDLTDASGEINSVAVSAGDLLMVTLFRDVATDTATSDADFPAVATEISFA